jgi:sugar O-acyltransferase (sialic acid O-acetyltransferase NeuD family)
LKKIIIIGSGGHSRVVIDTLETLGSNIFGIIDINYKGQKEKIFNYKIIGDMTIIDNLNPKNYNIILAIGDNNKREKYFSELLYKGFTIPTIIHPTAILSKKIIIGNGVFINSGVILNAGVEIADNTIINTGSIIEHEVNIKQNSHICPGVKIGGRATVGKNTFIGIGSSIKDYIKIGDNVKVGAGSVIIDNIKKGLTVVGVPGKEII